MKDKSKAKKTYTISSADLDELRFRNRMINEHKFIVSALEQSLNIFIDLSIKRNLSISPNTAVQIDYKSGKMETVEIQTKPEIKKWK